MDAGTNGFRLPTEAQWEYAARGGVPGASPQWTFTYAGSDTADEVAVYNGNSGGQTAAVKSKTGGDYSGANSLWLYDMSGNVYEWCWDVFSVSYRVARGGRWGSSAALCAVSYRTYGSPYAGSNYIGFRVSCP
jgi:formylglycine-generating enzyme required for sulfatase activity